MRASRPYPDLHDNLKALELAAQRALRGDYFKTGEENARRRRKDVRINTEVRDVPDSPEK